MRVKKPKKTGVRTRKNPLVINVWGKQWHMVISNKLVRMVMRNSKVRVGFCKMTNTAPSHFAISFSHAFSFLTPVFCLEEGIVLSSFTFYHKLMLYIVYLNLINTELYSLYGICHII